MAIFRVVALAALFVGSSILAEQAQGCDSNYPWLCKPVPPVEAAEPASKPLATGAKRRATVKTAKPAAERMTRKETGAAQEGAARREVLRTRSAPAQRPAVAPIRSEAQPAIAVAPQSTTTTNTDFPPAQTLERIIKLLPRLSIAERAELSERLREIEREHAMRSPTATELELGAVGTASSPSGTGRGFPSTQTLE